MPLGFRQWARFTKESTPGVYDDEADPADIIYPRLMEGDALSLEPDKQVQVERAADAGNEPTSQYGTRTRYAGSFRCLLRPDQAVALIPWGFKPVSRVLDSYTIDYFNGVEARRFLNCKVTQAQLSCDNQTDHVLLSYGLMPTRAEPLASFPEPDSALYPTKRPYLHRDSKGLVTLDGGVVVGYKSLQVTAANIIAADFDEDDYIAYADYAGRTVTWQVEVQATDNAMREAFELQTELADVKIKWDVSVGEWGVAHALEFDFMDINYISSLSSDRAFERRIYETIGGTAFKDVVAGTSMQVTVT